LFLLAAAVVTAVVVVALFAVQPAIAGSGGVATGGDKRVGSVKQSAASKTKYKRLWTRVSTRNRRWARRTSACESGRNPKAIGGNGRYRGAFQFMKATWRAAPKSPGGDPVVYTYKTQAVVAVALKRRDGRHHWPSCG
jgi:hypothetical protein